MMNFNPAMFWWQWMLDQMDEGEGGEGVPRMSMRMGLAAQLAAMKSYKQMLAAAKESAKESGSLNQVYEATKKMVDEMWSAARQEQPGVVDAQITALDEMIKKLEQEQERAK